MPRITPPSPPPSGPPRRRRRLSPASGSSRRQPSVEQQLPTAADLFVKSLPGLSKDSHVTLYAGNLPSTVPTTRIVDDSDAHLYFLLAANRHIPNRHRLLLWLNGGPGCSSFDGALLEIGPIRVNADRTLSEVKNTAWNEYANVLFLDQPAGTGFSYVTKHDDVRELAEAAEHVVVFLSNLYKIFPEFLTMDTYIAGESYAGQYIPYIADAILKTTLIATPLKGLLIGNGWISPRDQYPAYLDYLVERGLLEAGTPAHKKVLDSVELCNRTIEEMDSKSDGSSVGMVLIPECEEILGAANAATMKDGLCLNAYNTTQWHDCGADWPTGLASVTPYLRDPKVVKALNGQPGSRWEQCSSVVGSHFWTYHSVPSVQLLPQLLETLPILLFAGDQDLMCAGLGIERMIENLEWGGDIGFGVAEVQEWSVDQVPAGQWTTARGLTYVKFYNASHMVPIDQPVAAHDMVLRFMQVDTLHAAGAAARVPSRIGKETEAVVGATSPDGSTLEGIVADAESPHKDVTEDGFDKDHEIMFGPRRTAALFVLLALGGVAIWAFFHWRGERRRARYRRLKGKGRSRPSRGIRLEETDLSSAEEARALPPLHKPSNRPLGRHVRIVEPIAEPIETATVFDVEHDDDDDDEPSEGDEEAQGDLGRTRNPWQEPQK